MTRKPVITLPLDEARKVFDTAVGSMNFASGFLDNDEVDALRAFAVRLGLDPMDATPHVFSHSYPHPFVAGYYPTKCQWCDELEDDELHQ